MADPILIKPELCNSCQYANTPVSEDPCLHCVTINSDINNSYTPVTDEEPEPPEVVASKFEVCKTCQYYSTLSYEEPCSICRRLYYDKYVPTEEEIEEDKNKTIIKYHRFPDKISMLDDNNEYTGIVPTSRYQVLRVVIDGEDTYLEGYNQLVVPESSEDIYHVVREKEVNRLDIISNEYYQTPYFWWAIALANNFVDPFVVNEGVMLRIPAVTTLYDPRNMILDRTKRRGLWQS